MLLDNALERGPIAVAAACGSDIWASVITFCRHALRVSEAIRRALVF